MKEDMFYRLLPDWDQSELEDTHGPVAIFSSEDANLFKLTELLVSGENEIEWPTELPVFKEIKKGFYPDKLCNSQGWLIMSESFFEVLCNNNITGYQKKRIIVNYRKRSTKKKYDSVMYINNSYDCIDYDKSLYKQYNEIRPDISEYIMSMRKIVLHKDKIPLRIDIFRLKYFPQAIIVSERFKMLCIEKGITGFILSAVEIS